MAATGKEYVTLKQAKLLKDAGDKAISDAIAAEASARAKADELLSTGIEGKLDAADLVAGDNVVINQDPETGHVTISSTGGGDPYELPVATADALGGVKASEQILVAADGAMSLAHDSVTHNELANNSVMASHLTDLCVSATKIQNDAVGTNKIADGAVTADKIAAGVIPDVSGFITSTEADDSYAAKSHTHAVATTGAAGFMSAADKTKLNGLNNYTLPAATSTTLGGVKIATDTDFETYLGI